MQAAASGGMVGLGGKIVNVAEQQAKPTKQERAAARNELDRYQQMNWDNSQDSHGELRDPALWVSDTSNPTQLQEDIQMLMTAQQTLQGTSAVGHDD